MTSERNPERGFLNQKEKKWKMSSHWNGIHDHWKCRDSKFNQAMDDDSMLRAVKEKRISGNRSVKVRIFP